MTVRLKSRPRLNSVAHHQAALAKQSALILMATVLVGWMTAAHSHDPSLPLVTVAPPNLTPARVSALRVALREFDRFLDHHPLLEDELRLDPALTRDQQYLQKNSELAGFLAGNPDVLPALSYYPRYFLYHALLQQANAPLRYSEVSQLKDVLDHQPAVEHALIRQPELIRDAAFVRRHPPLLEFFSQHSQLRQVFLPPAQPDPKRT